MGDDTKRTEKTEVTTEEKKNRWSTPTSQPDEVTEYKKVTKKETEEKEDDDSTIIVEE